MTIQGIQKMTGPYDPLRCQATTNFGQCEMQRMPDKQFCQIHTPNHKAEEKKRAQRINMSVWQNRVNEMLGSGELKDLSEEVTLLRITLEAVLSNCPDASSMMLHHAKIQILVQQITKTVESLHKVEQSSGFLLSLTSVIKLADNIISIVSNVINELPLTDKEKETALGLVKEGIVNECSRQNGDKTTGKSN